MKKESKRIKKILEVLDKIYPNNKTQLVHSNPFQLLIATMLSAQCTDKQVNKVTPILFKKYPDAKTLSQAKLEDLEEMIYSTGFYKNKAKNIKKCAEIIYKKYSGKVPNSLEELTKLPGVGRKTANVVLGSAFNIPAMVVDTHVKRISYRLALTQNKDPYKIELDLMKIIPKEKWNNFSLQLIKLGRNFCKSQNPKCNICPLKELCDYYNKLSNSKKEDKKTL